MDPRERFTAAAAAYNEHRPAYPEALFDWLTATTGVRPPAAVVDVGCGTGIATRQLAALGYEVTGVEPNEAMRAQAVAAGGAQYRAGEAAATGLPGGCAQLVVCAQAFHYFKLSPTLREWRRILVPGGACATFWYRIPPSPFRDGFRAVKDPHAIVQRSAGRSTPKGKIITTLGRHPDVVDLSHARFESFQALDLQGLLGRFAASSHLGGVSSPALVRDVEDLFARTEQGGRVYIPLETTAVAWRFAARGSPERAG
jgi:SAM-dependent methyltransferase